MAQHGALEFSTGPTYLSETLRIKKLIHGCAVSHDAIHHFGVQEQIFRHTPKNKKNQHQHDDAVLTARSYD